MVATTQEGQAGIGTFDQNQIANSIQQLKISDKRKRNEMMRLGTSDPSAFALQYQPQLQEATNPSQDFRQAGNPLNDAIYGLPQGYTKQDLGNGTYNIFNDTGENLGLGYDDLSTAISKLYKNVYNTQKENGQLDSYYSGKGFMDRSAINKGFTTFENTGQADPRLNSYGPIGQWESLGQLLNNKLPTAHDWGDLTTNGSPETISGLNTLFGSTPVFSNGQLIGYKTNLTPGTVGQGGDMNSTSTGVYLNHNGKSHAWSNNAWREFNPGDWSGVQQLDSIGNVFINKDAAANLPGWTNKDSYQHKDIEYNDGTGSALGILGSVLQFTPLAPIGVALSAAGAMANNNPVGAIAGIAGAGGAFDTLSNKIGSSLGVSKEVANAIIKGGLTSASSAASGASGKNTLLSGLASGLGAYGGAQVEGLTKEDLGPIISKMFGGAASGGLNSLFTRNSPVQGSLYGAMSGGLHGYLNSVAPNHDRENQQTAKILTNIFRRSRKR